MSSINARKLEVLTLAADGLSNKQIAYQLGLSPRTVEMHIALALVCLDACNRTHAVAICLRKGLIQ